MIYIIEMERMIETLLGIPNEEDYLIIMWTNDPKKALRLTKHLNSTWLSMYVSEHETLKEFKEYYVKKYDMIVNDDGTYEFPEEEYVWYPPAGLNRGKLDEPECTSTTKG